MVSASGDYNIHYEDPDKLVDWECIQQVVSQCLPHVMKSHVTLWSSCFRDYSVMKYHPAQYVSSLLEQVNLILVVSVLNVHLG